MTEALQKKPEWLRIKFRPNQQFQETTNLLRDLKLNTICDEGLCPNRMECFSHGVATFMLLGNRCTRNCKYCNVAPGKPFVLDMNEPLRVAEAVKKLNLKYVVLTSVNRDDLADGGAAVFLETIKKIKIIHPICKIELLIPDFKGKKEVLDLIIESNVSVISHNIETVKEIFPCVRPQGSYDISLHVLKKIKMNNPSQKTKSGLMLGLGENSEQIERTLKDLREQGCDFVTLGQYLRPSEKHHPVVKYYTPEEFKMWNDKALELGFLHVESGPLIRSSYRADKLVKHIK